ncbi:MAG: hypothetical protein ABIJ04_04800 [Bacteroidota bacterium]
MKNLIVFILIICPILICSCKRDKIIICTEEYSMLTVSIKDTASNPVILSQYFVKKTSTGEIIDFSQEDPYFDSINRIQGIYFVFTDGKMGMTSKNGTEFEFHGILGTTEIVNEKYIIGNDDCHVIMLSGKTEIVISK